jgi:hypothetical protein
VQYRLDALQGDDDLVSPGLGRGDLEGPARSAADQAGGYVQETVAGVFDSGRPGCRTETTSIVLAHVWRHTARNIEPVTSTLSGKECAQVSAMNGVPTCSLILQYPPTRATRTMWALMAHQPRMARSA